MKFNKKGVSLITVLLFMMVATIAATATYKWLSSEGRSSASRMSVSEARQAASAGIEAARSWMSYNANDVGAAVKQLLDAQKTNANSAIRLNSVLKEVQNDKLQSDVYLVSVNQDNSTYKMKIASVATDSKGTKYSEIAIFDVNGLYRVKIPAAPTSSTPANFKESFMGSFEDGISLDVTSAIVNGNMTFNTTVNVDEHLVVVGDANVNSNTQIKDFYVKGNLISCTNLNVSDNAYVEKKLIANGSNHFRGNLYVKEGIDATSNYSPEGAQCGTGTGGNLYVDKNLTSNGSIDLPSHSTAYPFEIKGNLVVTDGGKINFPDADDLMVLAQQYTFKVEKNASISGGFNGGSHITYTAAPYVSFGKSSADKLYLGPTNLYRVSNEQGYSVYNHWASNWISSPSPNKLGTYWYQFGDALGNNTFCNSSSCAPTEKSGMATNPNFYECASYTSYGYGMPYCTSYIVKRNEIFVQVNASIVNTAPDVTAWLAPDMSEYTDRIVDEETDGCGTKEHIEDPIQFNKALLNTSYVHTKSSPKHCSDKTFWNDWPNDAWKQLNECYKAAEQNNELYGDGDDKWLIIRFSDPSWGSGSTLDGNFIIIVDNTQSGQALTLPPTTASSNVILYFPNGYEKGLRTDGAGSQYNYFIFSEGDLGKKNVGSLQIGSGSLNGSIFLADCHKAYADQTVKVDYNETLISNLESIGAICGGSSGGCSTASGSSGGTSSTTEADDGKDNYYVATAPQLSVNLTSQYRNDEMDSKVVSGNDVNPSVIVLPRIVYIPMDPVGKLSDYYTVVPLNGASNDLLAKSMSCPTEISTSGNLYSSTRIPKGYYTCHYDENGLNVPLYVVVAGTRGENPTVSFADDDGQIEIIGGGTADVKLSAPSGNRQIKVQVSAPSPTALPSGWSYTPQSGVTKVSDDGTNAVYSITTTPSGNDIPLFRVATEASSVQADVNFQLTDPCDGCIIGSPFVQRVFMNGYVTVKRDSTLSTYCNEEGSSFAAQFSENCADVAARPNCGSLIGSSVSWVTATGQGCTEKTKNGSWQCNTGMSINLLGYEVNNQYCKVYVPSKTLSQMTLGESYELPGVIKRKPVTLVIDFAKKTGSGKVNVEYYRPGVTEKNTFTTWDKSPCTKNCIVSLYAGDVVLLTAENGTDRFSYWTCTGDDCNEENGKKDPSTSYKISMSKNASITATFNDKDHNCVYNDFSKTIAFCNSSSNDDCIDKCASGTNCSAKNGGSYPNSDWILVHANSKCGKYGWAGVKYCSDKHNSYDVFQTPIISDGNISSSTDGISDVLKTSVVLGRIEGGYNGTLTAKFQLPTASQTLLGKTINNGFIFRSDATASSYLSLNVLAPSYAQLCYVQGRDNSQCVESTFKGSLTDGALPVVFSAITKASISITANGNSIIASLSYNFGKEDFGSAYAQFDLSDTQNIPWGQNIKDDKSHEYIGFRLADPSALSGFLQTQFKIYDLAWKSATYASSCWDTPSVNCSFKANYSGGAVPQNENVSPWVSMSSWFTEGSKSCSVKYFYNGCDVPSSYFKDQHSILDLVIDNKTCSNGGLGYYKWSATELNSYKRGNLVDENYKFTETGLHGYPYQNGFVNEASVLVTCSEGSGGDGHLYTASCGEFNVGDIKQCTESYPNLISESTNCAAEGDCIPSMNTEGEINVREATIRFTISGLNSGSVSVYLVDKNGRRSGLGRTVTSSDTYTFSVGETVIGESGFNPQEVSGVVFVGTETSGYTISKIQSVCGYALSLICNDPVYNEQTQSWTISANVTHPEQAESCKITPLDDARNSSEIPEASTCAGFNQIVKQKGVYNQSSDQTYTFRISALDKDGNELASCEAEKEVPVVSFTTCEVASETVRQGAGVPRLSFSLSNCPDGGCEYTVYYDDEKIEKTKGTSESNRCPSEGCDGLNKINAYTAGSTHSYRVEAYGKICEPSFNVVVNENAPTCSQADISEGKYTATTSKSWDTGTLIITDGQRNVLVSLDVTGNETTNFEYDLGALGASIGRYYVTLSIEGNTCPTQTWNVTSASTSTKNQLEIKNCSVAETSQDPESAIVVSASVSGCDNNSCKLEISPATNNSSQIDDFGSNTFSFYDENKSGRYTATISRDNYESSSCVFTVSFAGESSEKCGCTCASGCDNVITTGISNTGGSGCYFIKKASTISVKYDDLTNHFLRINGTKVPYKDDGWGNIAQLCYQDESACESALSNYPKVDDGWYLEINTSWTRIEGNDAIDNPCASSGSGTVSGGGSGSGNTGSEFPCTASNSKSRVWHDGDAQDFVSNAGSCIKYSMGTGQMRIGCWWAPKTPVPVRIKKCDGSETTINHDCGGWVAVSAGENCDVYVTPQKEIKWDFSNW